MIHDPHHVAQLASMLLSSQGEAEPHHIEKAVSAARTILDVAIRRAEEDERAAAAKKEQDAKVEAAAPEKSEGDAQ